jgi:hypothetical protein
MWTGVALRSKVTILSLIDPPHSRKTRRPTVAKKITGELRLDLGEPVSLGVLQDFASELSELTEVGIEDVQISLQPAVPHVGTFRDSYDRSPAPGGLQLVASWEI